jgi:hypothetical protein
MESMLLFFDDDALANRCNRMVLSKVVTVLSLFAVITLYISCIQQSHSFFSEEIIILSHPTPPPTTTATTSTTASSKRTAALPTNTHDRQRLLVPSPVKIFLLIGQSNMQGHGYMDTTDENGEYRNGTLEWMVQVYPKQYGKLKTSTSSTSTTTLSSSDNSNTNKENNDTSSWSVRADTWIAYNKQQIGNVKVEMNHYGNLVPGLYGGDPGQIQQMGPELGFGWTVAESLNKNKNNNNDNTNNQNTNNNESNTFSSSSIQQQQILLIKIAWGGRSLAVDFRPPSSGGVTGLYYESVIAHTYKTLSQLGTMFPDYNDIFGGRYELAGLVWHQGWNDGCNTNMTKEYETNLANFIRDIRTDLNTPYLPVTIGVSGMLGYNNPKTKNPNPNLDAIIAAQFAVANSTMYPEFEGTVLSVETRNFLRPPLPSSPGRQGYHWNNNCETYWLIGEAMGKAMIQLISRQRSFPPLSNEDLDVGVIKTGRKKKQYMRSVDT